MKHTTRAIIAGLLALAAPAAAWAGAADQQPAPAPASQQAMVEEMKKVQQFFETKAVPLLKTGDFDRAVKAAEDFIRENPDLSESAKAGALVKVSLEKNLAASDGAGACRKLDEIVARFPNSNLATNAATMKNGLHLRAFLQGTATPLLKARNYDAATRAAEEFLTRHPDLDDSSKAGLLLNISLAPHLEARDADAACRQLDAVAARFPHSSLAKNAAAAKAGLRQKIAAQPAPAPAPSPAPPAP